MPYFVSQNLCSYKNDSQKKTIFLGCGQIFVSQNLRSYKNDSQNFKNRWMKRKVHFVSYRELSNEVNQKYCVIEFKYFICLLIYIFINNNSSYFTLEISQVPSVGSRLNIPQSRFIMNCFEDVSTAQRILLYPI
jgi:hypothetical protein